MPTGAGKAYFDLPHAIGSVIALTDEDGNKVDSYAYSPKACASWPSPPNRSPSPTPSAGGYQDPTVPYDYSGRFYDAHMGRFTHSDPSGQEQDPYLYA
ncbi:hypothetical protein [Streptomyces sp. NPDC005301]|uniref:hypothetical protein n=1 Tax=Streptomyces sp. NPDC005301 TaxID=3156874 RepID=UPI0033B6759C